jgi:EmrB/QacA subfamily drug resistance transporter
MTENDVNQRTLTPEILALAAVVVIGTIMTILDATIVNVALATLGHEFQTSIASIQWVATAYLLAFATVIPLTGWAGERFGAKRVWLVSLTLFTVCSLLCGLAWSLPALIVFRFLQGLAAGMILPLGQSMLAQAAGRERMGRVMSIVGVPMLLAPVLGPAIGGVIVGTLSWRWIFFVNLPVGLVAIALAVRLLPDTPSRREQRPDTLGLLLLSGGIALFVYGLAEIGVRGSVADWVPLAASVGGLALVALYVVHALRTPNPLIDVRLFAARSFATVAATNFVLGVAVFGVVLLLPLYLQIVRGQSVLATGLLLIPQGLGAAVAMPIAGTLTDKLGARRVVLAGVGFALLGTLAYTQIDATTPYWYLCGALFLIGLGLGATIMPSMAAAYQSLPRDAVPRATSALHTIQRVAGSLGIALLAVVLQRAMQAELPSLDGGLAAAGELAASEPATTKPALAAAFAATYWVAFGLTSAALLTAAFLPARAPADTTELAPAAGSEERRERKVMVGS